MIRIIAKVFAVTVALTAFLHVGPLHASPFAFVASGGSGVTCGSTTPCASIAEALTVVDAGGEIFCLDSTVFLSGGSTYSSSVTIDCPGVFLLADNESAALALTGNQAVTIRNLSIRSESGALPAVKVIGSGTLIIENCVFERMNGTALDIEPTGPLNLVIKNSRISNNAAGVLIQPQSGGSVTATFDGVTIADNSGGGLKTDTVNGPVTVDISNSTISKNAGNGLNAVGGAGGPNMLNIIHDVIASNGNAGIQANGTNAAAVINGSVLDSNTAGATAVIGAGRILTYGNNSIVGSPGSGFTASTPLQ
jgi:hypothetical protein